MDGNIVCLKIDSLNLARSKITQRFFTNWYTLDLKTEVQPKVLIEHQLKVIKQQKLKLKQVQARKAIVGEVDAWGKILKERSCILRDILCADTQDKWTNIVNHVSKKLGTSDSAWDCLNTKRDATFL